jgi:hypothetical protein
VGLHNRADYSCQEKLSLKQAKAVESVKPGGKFCKPLVVEPAQKSQLELVVERASQSIKHRLEQFSQKCFKEVEQVELAKCQRCLEIDLSIGEYGYGRPIQQK